MQSLLDVVTAKKAPGAETTTYTAPLEDTQVVQCAETQEQGVR